MIKKAYKLSLLSSLIAGSLAIPAVQADDIKTAANQKAEQTNASNPPEKQAARDKEINSGETMVVTAKEQTLQAWRLYH